MKELSENFFLAYDLQMFDLHMSKQSCVNISEAQKSQESIEFLEGGSRFNS